MKLSLRERIKRYFQRRPNDLIASGDLQRLVADTTQYTPSNLTRRLRELENDNFLAVEYHKRNGVEHAFYRLKGTSTPKPTSRIEIVDGRPLFVTH